MVSVSVSVLGSGSLHQEKKSSGFVVVVSASDRTESEYIEELVFCYDFERLK